MAGFLRLHNKFHRSSHHTLSSASVQDQGIDPIASEQEPFNGIFYNNLTDQERTYNILTNSYDWYSTHATVSSLSANWELIETTYTTVCANSSNWEKGYSAYNTLCAVSGNYESTYSTVCANSANWANEYVLYTNRVQENTRSKTFSAYNLTINGDDSVDWNLDIAQVAYLKLDRDVTLKNPLESSKKSGGLYNLHVIQGDPAGGYSLTFQNNYIFPVGVNISTDLNQTLSGSTIFSFFSDGYYMYGEYYKTNLLEPGLITIIDGIPIREINGVYLYPISEKGIISFEDHQMNSFNDEEIFPFGESIVRFSSNETLVRFGNNDPIVPMPYP